jgi:hypothetical protein
MTISLSILTTINTFESDPPRSNIIRTNAERSTLNSNGTSQAVNTCLCHIVWKPSGVCLHGVY